MELFAQPPKSFEIKIPSEQAERVFEALNDSAPPEVKPIAKAFSRAYHQILGGSVICPRFIAAIDDSSFYPESQEKTLTSGMQALALSTHIYLELSSFAQKAPKKAAHEAAQIAPDFRFHADNLTIGSTIFLTLGTIKVQPYNNHSVEGLVALSNEYLALDYDLSPEATVHRGQLINRAINLARRAHVKASAVPHLQNHIQAASQWLDWRTGSDTPITQAAPSLAAAATSSLVTPQKKPDEIAEAARRAAHDRRDTAFQSYQELLATGRNGRPLTASGKEIRREGLQRFSYYLHNGYEDKKDGVILSDINQQRAPLVLGLFLAMYSWLEKADDHRGATNALSTLLQQEQALQRQLLEAGKELGLTQSPQSIGVLQETVQWMQQEWTALEHIILKHEWPADPQQRRQFSFQVKEVLQSSLITGDS